MLSRLVLLASHQLLYSIPINHLTTTVRRIVMVKLTKLALGNAMRTIIYARFGRAVHAANAIDVDAQDLRRAWGKGNQASRHHSFDRMLDYLDKLGYEVHFSVVKKVTNERGHYDSKLPRAQPSDAL
jgi:hypothetical protein